MASYLIENLFYPELALLGQTDIYLIFKFYNPFDPWNVLSFQDGHVAICASMLYAHLVQNVIGFKVHRPLKPPQMVRVGIAIGSKIIIHKSRIAGDSRMMGNRHR